MVPFTHELAARCDAQAAQLEADAREWQRLLPSLQATHGHMLSAVALLRVAAAELRGQPSLPPRPAPIPNPRVRPPDSPF